MLVETYGWPQFVDQVAAAARTVPPQVPIFTSNYGEAGALQILGPKAGVDRPVYSGHNNYGLWGPPSGTPDSVLCVGKFKAGYLEQAWTDVREIASITFPKEVDNSEKSARTKTYLCQKPRGSWEQLWSGLKHLD